MTPHLASLGAVEIDAKDYLVLLDSALGGGEAGGGRAARLPWLGAWSSSERSTGCSRRGAGGRRRAAAGMVIAQLLGQTS